MFRKLGQLKTREALELGVDVPKDSRAPALVFITAVHSASPEYNFEVFEYLPNETVVRVFGVSRYDRIAKKLDIERYLSWPELLPFFEGVAEEMGINARSRASSRSSARKAGTTASTGLPCSPAPSFRLSIRRSPREPSRPGDPRP